MELYIKQNVFLKQNKKTQTCSSWFVTGSLDFLLTGCTYVLDPKALLRPTRPPIAFAELPWATPPRAPEPDVNPSDLHMTGVWRRNGGVEHTAAGGEIHFAPL